MKVWPLAISILLTPAGALAGPAGKWRVGDGTAHVQIRQCGGEALCGTIASVKDKGRDENNPNPALRSRSLVGAQILHLSKAGENLWSGTIYNAKNGQNYAARMSMKTEQLLTVEGCVPGTNVCGEDRWTRAR
jgi:uncharacterized protein (DUF2147 family)